MLMVATPWLVDPNFWRTVVYLFSLEDGAAGVILNRPTDVLVASTLPNWEQATAVPRVVHLGGPVQVEHAVALGTGHHSEMVTSDVGVVDLDQDPDHQPPGTMRLFAGYAGWDPGQLDAEVAEQAWFPVAGSQHDLLDPDPSTLWRRVLARQDDPISRFARFPEDPGLN
jgi:putative transcriptional regulator